MALRYVTVLMDGFDASGAVISTGLAQIAPNVQLSAPADEQWIPQAQVTVPFSPWQASPPVKLLATDNADITPPGWAYQVTFAAVPGNPATFGFFLPAGPVSFTASNGSPCVFTPASGTYGAGSAVQLAGAGLPAGFTAGTTYFVVSPGTGTFELAATLNGTPLGSTSTGSGTVLTTSVYLSSLTPVFPVPSVETYLPLPSGTPAAGNVPFATGTGEASAWGYVSGALLASRVYAPGTLATPAVTSGTLAAFDSANIQTGSFTAPASGSVIVEAAFQAAPPSTAVYGFALAPHATVTPVANTVITSEVSSLNVQSFTNLRWIVGTLTAGTSYNFDLLGATAAGTLSIRAVGSSSSTPTGATGGPVSLTVTAI